MGILDIFKKKEKKEKDCKHEITRRMFDLETEKVLTFCCECGELLSSVDPYEIEKEMEKSSKNIKLYLSLRKKR